MTQYQVLSELFLHSILFVPRSRSRYGFAHSHSPQAFFDIMQRDWPTALAMTKLWCGQAQCIWWTSSQDATKTVKSMTIRHTGDIYYKLRHEMWDYFRKNWEYSNKLKHLIKHGGKKASNEGLCFSLHQILRYILLHYVHRLVSNCV